jgi:hypothetical protein
LDDLNACQEAKSATIAGKIAVIVHRGIMSSAEWSLVAAMSALDAAEGIGVVAHAR